MPAQGYGHADILSSKEQVRAWLGLNRARFHTEVWDAYPELRRRLTTGLGRIMVSEAAQIIGLTADGRASAPRPERRGLPKKRAS